MNRLNVERLAEALSEILSDRTGAEVKVRFVPKEAREEKSA